MGCARPSAPSRPHRAGGRPLLRSTPECADRRRHADAHRRRGPRASFEPEVQPDAVVRRRVAAHVRRSGRRGRGGPGRLVVPRVARTPSAGRVRPDLHRLGERFRGARTSTGAPRQSLGRHADPHALGRVPRATSGRLRSGAWTLGAVLRGARREGRRHDRPAACVRRARSSIAKTRTGRVTRSSWRPGLHANTWGRS